MAFHAHAHAHCCSHERSHTTHTHVRVCDRDRGDVHIGTLLRIMPSDDCEGGSLVIEGRRITPSRTEDCLVFIPFGVPHLVTPVTAGMRWVAKASVHVPAADAVLVMPYRPLPAIARSDSFDADRTERLVRQVEAAMREMGIMGLPPDNRGGDDDDDEDAIRGIPRIPPQLRHRLD
jgi:hypothetical protein